MRRKIWCDEELKKITIFLFGNYKAVFSFYEKNSRHCSTFVYL